MIKPINSVQDYKRNIKVNKIIIFTSQVLLLFAFIGLWEVLAQYGLINKFLVSCPSEIMSLFISYLTSGELWSHVSISLYETLLGLVIGTILGLIIAILLWLNDYVAKILDPFLVVLNALPKTALAPILIVWAGTGVKGIVLVAVSLSLVVTILSAYNYFKSVDQEQYKMLVTLKASKWQILRKLVLPSNVANIINIIKINIGMSWVGVIVGEFLVSRAGIGYLVVYGGQVFKLDLVMMGVFVLGLLALIMYLVLNYIEKYYRYMRYKKRRKNEKI